MCNVEQRQLHFPHMLNEMITLMLIPQGCFSGLTRKITWMFCNLISTRESRSAIIVKADVRNTVRYHSQQTAGWVHHLSLGRKTCYCCWVVVDVVMEYVSVRMRMTDCSVLISAESTCLWIVTIKYWDTQKEKQERKWEGGNSQAEEEERWRQGS